MIRDDRIRLLQMQLNDIAKQLAALQRLDNSSAAAAIHGASAKTTPVDADTMPLIDSAASNVLKKVTWANIKATLKTYFDTLYVALTGNQSIAGVKTFTNGISLGNETLSVYDEGTWSPVITGSGSNPTIDSYTVQIGQYWRYNGLMHYYINLVLGTVSSAGTGDLRISLPAVSAGAPPGNVRAISLDVPGTPFEVSFLAVGGQAYGRMITSNDNAAATVVAVTAITTGTQIAISGFYLV